MMKLLLPFVLGLSLITLNGCGGGGSMVAEGGIGGTGVSMGRVSSFGSLFVNGVEFDVNSSDFIYEGQPAVTVGDDSGIRVGMVVRITGAVDGATGMADIVEYASLFMGTLSSKTIASNETGTLDAMGQHVTVDADTVYDDGGSGKLLSALPLGALIEVSGFSDGMGNVLATRIEVKAQNYSGETLDVKGLASSLDTSIKSFQLGSLNIIYSAIDLPAGITEGTYVEAKGTLQNNTLVASDVQIEDDGDLVIADDGEEAELEGLVTRILATTADSSLIIVNGQQVLVDANSRFEPTGNATNLVIGQPLEVSGVMDNVTLVAAKVALKAPASQKEELEGVPSIIDPNSNTITLLDQTIRVTTFTIFEDDLSDSKTFNLNSLTPGVDYLSIDLFQAADGLLEASKVERNNNPSSDPRFSEVEGYIQAVDLGLQQISAVNVTIDITDPTLSGFTPVQGDRVEIFGVYDAASGILQASSVSTDID